LSKSIQEKAKMTGMKLIEATYLFSENIEENAKMTGMMFMMKHCPYFL